MAAFDPVAEADQILVSQPVELLDENTEVEPLLARDHHEPDEAVLRGVNVGEVGGSRCTEGLTLHVEPCRAFERSDEDVRLQPGDVQQLTVSGWATEHRHEPGDRPDQSGRPFARTATDQHRRQLGCSSLERPARERLQRRVRRGATTPVAVEAERRQRDDLQVWVTLAQSGRCRCRAVAERPIWSPHSYVRCCEQLVQAWIARLVDDDALLGAAQELEQGTVLAS